MDLLGEYNASATFNVANLSPFNAREDSRMNPFEEKGNDAIYNPRRDPLLIPLSPITRA